MILTLAAIAREIITRKAGTKENVVLAVGLLLISYQPVKFDIEDRSYKVTINDVYVYVYPQGYSAIVDYVDKLKKEPSVIICHIGSWTVDVMRIDNGIPNADTCRSLELGIIRMIDIMLEEVRRNT